MGVGVRVTNEAETLLHQQKVLIRHKQDDVIDDDQRMLYEQESERVRNRLQDVAALYIAGTITLESFRDRAQRELKTFYIRLALIGSNGADLSEQSVQELLGALATQYQYLDGFIEDLRRAEQSEDIVLSDRYIFWRIGLYSLGWDRVVRHAIPDWLSEMLPAFPGVDCLGGPACGCSLAWETSGESVLVWWVLDVFKEHCVVCIDLAAEWSPLELPLPIGA